MNRTTWIQGGRILDPATGRDEIGDLFFDGGRIAKLPDAPPANCEIVDASGQVITPGFWDIHVHLREPGNDAAETVETGSRAAAHGGFTTIVAMPNTHPALDTPELVNQIIEKGRSAGYARVLTTACITKDRAGKVLAPLAELADAGAIAFTDDGSTVPSPELMRRGMEEARTLNRLIMDHAQDSVMERRGVMHQGLYSQKYGLPGIPSEAETSIVKRDAELAEETGAAIHIQHITAGGSIDILRDAQARGVRISAEISPHHLALTDADVDPTNANYKMNPPLRSTTDRDRLMEGLLEHVVDVFATDHAPHTAAAKQKGWLEGPFGVVGLETAIGVTFTLLVKTGKMDVMEWVRRWTMRPASLLGMQPPALSVGSRADVVMLDLEEQWTVDPNQFHSNSLNTPFTGWALTGRAAQTWLEGQATGD